MVLWRALPVKGGTDPDGVLDDYQFALQDCSALAVGIVIDNLRAGKIEGESTTFCPKAPQLGVLARAEQRRLDAASRPKEVTTSYRPVQHEFKDWRMIHRQKADARRNKGQVCTPGISIDDWNIGLKRRRWKVGSTWFWSISEVWGPE